MKKFPVFMLLGYNDQEHFECIFSSCSVVIIVIYCNILFTCLSLLLLDCTFLKGRNVIETQ